MTIFYGLWVRHLDLASKCLFITQNGFIGIWPLNGKQYRHDAKRNTLVWVCIVWDISMSMGLTCRWVPEMEGKCKVLSYSLPSTGHGADPSVQAASPQVTWSHPPGGRLPLLSARLAFTFPAEEHHRPSADTKLYCLVTEAHASEQFAKGCYLEADRPRFKPANFWIASERSTIEPHRPQKKGINKKNYYISLTPQKSSMGGFAPDLAHGFVSSK